MSDDKPIPISLVSLMGRVEANFDPIKKLIEEAYEAGRRDERENLTAELKSMQGQLARLLGDASQTQYRFSSSRDETEQNPPMEPEKPRAKRGSVRPAVIDLLTSMPIGPTVKEVFAFNNEYGAFQIAEPSIRSTLGDLRKEGLVRKHGERWFIVEKEKGSGEPEPSSNSKAEAASATSAEFKSERTHQPASNLGSSGSGPNETGSHHRVRSDLLSGTASFAPFNTKHPSQRG